MVVVKSRDEMVSAIAELGPGEKVRLKVAMATVSVRRLDQSDPVYRAMIVGGKRGQRRGADGAAAWIAERVL